MDLTITSAAFRNGAEIPKKFTCDGADVSPSLSWTGTPGQTQSFTLIADDPDAPAGTWTHWVLYDLPAGVTELQENVSKVDKLPNDARQGRNDFRKLGYGGPCPPPGKPHRYYFKLYAVDTKLNLAPGASKDEVEKALQGHVVAKAELMGRYSR
jgi:Raf kinase inhibitor-like YbhB/YbcL family protein